MTTNFQDGNTCYDIEANWKKREMTSEELALVADMVRGYSNVTVTGVSISKTTINVQLAVNQHSRAKYPNNHREYYETRSLEKAEWQGWY